jgi:2-methylcitrate dehydratase PrpD
MIGEFAGPPQATLIGHARKLDALNAAVVNGISSNILDYDDCHARIVVHPTASIGCALAALSEVRPISGRDFLHALVLGIEVECRLLDPRVAEYKFAWSPTTTVAALGSAAACARAMGLGEQQIAWALGIAATQASGLRETGGTMSKAFNAGQASRCGLAAALLAARGFTGSETALEGPNGFIAAFGEARNVDAVVDGWGSTYQIEMNTFKPFPCGIVTHAAIDACLELYRQGVRGETVRSVQLNVHPVVARLTGRENPAGPLEAKLSVGHTAAAALRYGRVGVKEFSPACIADPQVVRLRKSTSVVVEQRYATDEAEVALTLVDGRVLTQHIEHAVGSLERPMTDAGLEEKLRGLAEDVLTDTQMNALIARVWSLEKLDDASALADACRAEKA